MRDRGEVAGPESLTLQHHEGTTLTELSPKKAQSQGGLRTAARMESSGQEEALRERT